MNQHSSSINFHRQSTNIINQLASSINFSPLINLHFQLTFTSSTLAKFFATYMTFYLVTISILSRFSRYYIKKSDHSRAAKWYYPRFFFSWLYIFSHKEFNNVSVSNEESHWDNSHRRILNIWLSKLTKYIYILKFFQSNV